jgi:fructose-bisphosphate aldolase class I
MTVFQQQFDKIRTQDGFIAALDQSGGSTPKALKAYGIGEDAWKSEEEMLSIMHAMRTRIIVSPSFNGDRILGAILFENTMDRTIESLGTAEYLWTRKRIVPFLKVDKGLEAMSNGVQLMKPIPGLTDLLERARSCGVFGTKMRSVIAAANKEAIAQIVAQQFEVADTILGAGFCPIIEPEVDINCPDKAQAETILLEELTKSLNGLSEKSNIMLKLTIPSTADLYLPLAKHPRVLKVVALSGGYSREQANQLLAKNHQMIASFSRALTEGLKAQLTDKEFDRMLDEAIQSIFLASKNKA